jgi:arginase
VPDFTFLGVPADSVGRGGGAETAPAAIRRQGLVELLGGRDAGDLAVSIRGEERDPGTGILASDSVLATTRVVRGAVEELLRASERPFLAGGCCALVPGALAGARAVAGQTGLVYVDGHLDLYDGTTSPTGEAADMPLGVALGLGPVAWVDACGGAPVAAADVHVLGPRDLDESQTYGMTHPDAIAGLTFVDGDAVRRAPAAVGERAVASMLAGPGLFWLALDVDVLDERVFPATDYATPGGLELHELEALVRPLLRSSALAGVSLACFNPDKDPGGRCGRGLAALLRRALA